jgi:hypothetical protein
MNRSYFLGYLLAGLVMSLALILPVEAGGNSESKVKATATATKAGDDGKQTVTITLEMVKGWHIYANPVGAVEFEANKTVVAISAKEKVVASVKYPEGKVKIEKLDKEVKMRIYEDKVTIQAFVTRTMGDTSPLQISIDVNACDANNCLPKGVLKLTVPITK